MAWLAHPGHYHHMRLLTRPALRHGLGHLRPGRPHEAATLRITAPGGGGRPPVSGTRALHVPAVVESSVQTTCQLISDLHAVTHTPWFVTIPLVAVAVNAAFRLPFTVYAHKVAQRRLKLTSLLTAWAIRHKRDVDRDVGAGRLARDKGEAEHLKRQRKTLRRLFREFDVQTWKTQGGLLSLPFWLLAIESLRRLCGGPRGLLGQLLGEKAQDAETGAGAERTASLSLEDLPAAGEAVSQTAASPLSSLADPTLATEGCLWFPDLMVSDPYHILPFVLSAAMVANMIPDTDAGRRALFGLEDRSAAPGNRQAATNTALALSNLRLRRALLLLGAAIGPVTAALPAGLHLYWISSVSATYLSGKVVKRFIPISRPTVRPCEGIELPIVRPPPQPPTGKGA